jgi:hypothetical protein
MHEADMKLNIESNIADPDAFYERLIEAHNGLSDEDSHMLNAKLVLLLANHIGDVDVIDEALSLARRGLSAASARTERELVFECDAHAPADECADARNVVERQRGQ